MTAPTGQAAPGGVPLRPGDPERVGPYRLVGRLGAGGMGTVYLALAPSGQNVALKVVRPEYADDPVFRGRFRRETEAAARVGGPAVARVLDADADAPLPYLVTEYVPGPSLRDHVTSAGPLRGDALGAFALGSARALAAVHAAGVVHRDLKPANVLVGADGPRLVDFGIARPADAATELTSTGEIVGSMGWMAPEVLRGERSGPAADVFGWGALVAFAGTGQRPFGDGPEGAVLHRVLAGPPPDLTGLPPRLAAAAGAALHPDPRARPSAAALADALALGLPLRAVPPVDPVRPVDAVRPVDRAPAGLTDRLPGTGETHVAPPQSPPVVPSPRGPGSAPPRRRGARRVLALGGSVAALALVGALAHRTPSDPTALPPQPTGTAEPAAAATPTPAPSTPTPTRSGQKVSPGPSASPSSSATLAPVLTPTRHGVLLATLLRAARDGDVVFWLGDVRCGATTVGQGARAYDLPAGQSACTAYATIRNLGASPVTLPWQTVHGPDGQSYASNGLLVPALGRRPSELATLPPHSTMRTGFVWELPAGVRPVDIELKSGLLSVGVRRRLP